MQVFKKISSDTILRALYWHIVIILCCVGFMPNSGTMEYASYELKDINRLSTAVLDNDTLSRINELGLGLNTTRKRGQRGGRRVKKDNSTYYKAMHYDSTLYDCTNADSTNINHNEQYSIPGVISCHRKPTVLHSRGVSASNLTKITPEISKANNFLTFGLLNCRSVRSKEFVINQLILDAEFDVLCLTETWLSEDFRTEAGLLTPTGFVFEGKSRQCGRGGGVAMITKSSIETKTLSVPSATTFEVMGESLKLQHRVIRVYNIYRPPPNSSNGYSDSQFLDEFADFLAHIAVLENVIILGDFNIHVDDCQNRITTAFASLLQNCGFEQHIKQATHNHGHTLDLVITNTNDLQPHAITVTDPCISDHKCISLQLQDTKPRYEKHVNTIRDRKSLDINNFKQQMQSCFNDKMASLDELVSDYNQTLTNLYDDNVPEKPKTVVLRPNTRWFTDLHKEEKKKRRRLERRRDKTGLMEDVLAYEEQCKHYNNLIDKAKTELYSGKIIENSSDKRKLFETSKDILNWRKKVVCPSGCSKVHEQFSDYFINKIVKIQGSICEKQSEIENIELLRKELEEYTGELLEEFTSISESELQTIVLGMSNASCMLDPLPTDLLKLCIDEILPALTRIVNLSIQNSEVSRDLKVAVVKPLLKKMSLDPEEFKNYRPVSNLSFLSKVIEKVIAVKLQHHLDSNRLCEPMQSAYRRFHSTETALLKIHNDLLCSLDKKHINALVLLDLSAAFDTVSHKILLSRLESRYGIRGSALQWFKSYLSNRGQFVKIEYTSTTKDLPFGLPQGSILGPVLFTLYTAPLGDIARSHKLGNHFYADDSQLYVALKNAQSVETLEKCISKYREWMIANNLKINEDKTEVVIIGSRYNLQRFPGLSINVGGQKVSSSDSAINLGVVFDAELSMSDFVNKKVSTCMYHLKAIAKIRRFLTLEATQSLVQAFVISRLDYCNSLLYGVSKQNIQKLQKVQNAAAKVVLQCHKFSRATPLLKQLHWLPVSFRIQFRILVHVFKSLNDSSPQYIKDLLATYNPARNLRSQSRLLLQENKVHNQYGSRAFANCGPKLFNALPESIKRSSSLSQFKKNLKTFMFRRAFNNVS